MPVPINPNVNSQYAPSPANGRSASEACLAVSMFLKPCACSVAAVVRMIKNITRLEKNIPVNTSPAAPLSSRFVEPRRLATVVFPCFRSSSTSCDACQKNR